VTRGVVLLCAVAVAGVLACALAAGARADGDPASDFLITQPVYFPYDGKFSPQLEGQLLAVMNEAKKRGFPIKVALIPNSYDLGSVGVLWRKPRLYARFLGEEDATFFKQRLLIVMPNGFGFYHPGHTVTDEYAALATIPIRPGDNGLVRAALAGVQKLAAADGVDVTAPSHVTTPAQRNSHDRLVIIVAVAGLLVLGGLLRLGLRRRAAPRPRRQ
jgi:hypothetical protein